MTPLAHGVGRVYEAPLPLSLYLLGAAATVIVSFLVQARSKRGKKEPRTLQLLWGRGASSVLATFRILALAAFVLTFIFAVMEPERGITVATLLFWLGLVVGTTLACSLIDGLWSQTNPWRTLEGFWRLEEPDTRRREPAWWLGPLLIYVLFWFELVSGWGFEPTAVMVFLLGYTLFYFTYRHSFGRHWENADPLSILFGFAGRVAPLRAESGWIAWRGWVTGLDEKEPMPLALYASVFVLLASTTLDNVRETVQWSTFLDATGLDAISRTLIDSVALVLLALPFFLPFIGSMYLAKRWSRKASSVSDIARRYAWSLVPIGVAYVLAHNTPLVITGLPQLLDQFVDAFGIDWFRTYLPSPQLVWFLEIALIVGGHILGVLAAHRTALRLAPSHAVAVRSHTALTLVMSFFTIATLYLLSLPLVRGR